MDGEEEAVRDPVSADPDGAEFGPGGYLPARAAQRARKIVLREQMGMHWPIAAVVAGVLILAVTIPFVISSQGPPGPPFVEAGLLHDVPPAGDAVLRVEGTSVLVVRAGGVLRGFVSPPDGARWCPASRRIESAEGQVWTAEGRLIGGAGESLARGRVQAYDDVLFIDPTPGTAIDPLVGDTHPACHDVP